MTDDEYASYENFQQELVNEETGKSNLNMALRWAWVQFFRNFYVFNSIDMALYSSRDIDYVVSSLTSPDNIQNRTISHVIFKEWS